jgi:NAD(P)-dependent dehydrogenase (short-subunit alcohol dehydrogenase family)
MSTKSIALITGTSSGFGLLSCVELARNGLYVVATMRNLEKRSGLEQAMEQAGLRDYEIMQMDVTKREEVEQVIAQVIEKHGQIDVLVNNAGFGVGGFVEDLSLEDYQEQFATNFFGMVAVTKAVIPHMRARRQGKVINISSISGRIGFPGMSAYVSSKFAMEGFSESLRLELLPYGVYVTLIEPGSYQTEIWEKSLVQVGGFEQTAYPQEMEKILKYVKKISQTASDPQEVAHLIAKVAKTKRPKLRYLIGKGTKNTVLLKNLLPWEWLERQIVKRMK